MPNPLDKCAVCNHYRVSHYGEPNPKGGCESCSCYGFKEMFDMIFEETRCACGHRFDSHCEDGGECEGYMCSCGKFKIAAVGEKESKRSEVRPWTKEESKELTDKVIKALNINTEGRYEKLGRELGALVEEKNKAYGSAFDRAGEILKILYPNGIKPEQYVDALGITRILDKLFRISTGNDYGQEDAWQDIAGYGILGTVRKRDSPYGSDNETGSEKSRT